LDDRSYEVGNGIHPVVVDIEMIEFVSLRGIAYDFGTLPDGT